MSTRDFYRTSVSSNGKIVLWMSNGHSEWIFFMSNNVHFCIHGRPKDDCWTYKCYKMVHPLNVFSGPHLVSTGDFYRISMSGSVLLLDHIWANRSAYPGRCPLSKCFDWIVLSKVAFRMSCGLDVLWTSTSNKHSNQMIKMYISLTSRRWVRYIHSSASLQKLKRLGTLFGVDRVSQFVFSVESE